MTIQALMSYIDSKELVINRYGIRQGVIFKQLNLPNHSFLDYSLCNLLTHFKLDEHHNDRLKPSTLTLANQLGIKDPYSVNILKTISKLHQIGQVISYQNVNKHTFHLLMNIQVNGLTPKEQLMCAYAVKLLDRFNIKLEHATVLNELELAHCKKLSLILQLTSYLNALKQEFTSLHVKEKEIQLKFSQPIPNIYTGKLETLSHLYIETFNKQLVIH